MIVFMRGHSQWRVQLKAALPGAVVGLVVALAVRYTSLTPPVRVLVATLPMAFLFTLLSPFERATPLAVRIRRAALLAVLFSTSLGALILVA